MSSQPNDAEVGSQPGTQPRAAAFFDLDKTIIATSSAAAFARPFLRGGLLSRRAALRTAYAQLLYLIGSADATGSERLRQQLSRMATGWDVSALRAIVEESLHEAIDPVVYAEAVELIAEHRAAGRDVVVVSASPLDMVQPIATVLGADHVIASRMGVLDERYTGGIDFYAFGPEKATAMRALAAERGYDLAESFAYSDSVTDAPMLSAVGRAWVVNPDRALRRRAAEEGWGTVSFRRPVRLGGWEPGPSALAMAAGGVTLGVAVGFVLARAVAARTPRASTM